MTEILTGRCLCGAIRYRCGPLLYPPALCHCESCRRASGAHAVGWLTVRSQDLEYLGNSPREFASSPAVLRSFCGQCGTPLAYRAAERPTEVDITLCTLDDPERAAPADHIWMQDAPTWDLPGDTLPRYPQGRK
jgi:hypothetical protein